MNQIQKYKEFDIYFKNADYIDVETQCCLINNQQKEARRARLEMNILYTVATKKEE